MFDTMSTAVKRLTGPFVIISSIALAATAHALSGQVTVAWDPNPETDIAGYNVYYGVVGAGVTNKVSPGNTTQQQVVSLQPHTQYWFYVTAFNTEGLESDPSQVLTYTTPVNQAPTVSLGGNRIAIIPATLSISAQATDDYLTPDQLNATWSQLAGPATVGIAGGTKFNPAFNFTVPGTYTFRVTVSDGYNTATNQATVYAYQQMTNPPPGSVVPDIQGVFPTADGLVIQWASAPGATYRIAHKDDLNQTTWTIIADNVPAQGPTSYWVDASGMLLLQGFYAIFQIP